MKHYTRIPIVLHPLQMDPESSVVPLEYVITLRPGDPVPLPINVTTVRQVPLDLYILFDLSMSTSDEVMAIRTVASTIRKWVEGKGGWRERREEREEERGVKREERVEKVKVAKRGK